MRFILAFLLCIATLPLSGWAQISIPHDSLNNYHLVWADEFNKDGNPDSTKWAFERGFVRNHELQWYQPENAFCEKGVLVIEARKTNLPNPRFSAEGKDWRAQRKSIEYTSSCLLTRGIAAWQYGIFEMRARIDIRNGLWPAWWTLGVSKPWPANGEIDIMEYYRGMLLANVATKGENGKTKWFDPHFDIDSMGGQQWASQFHVWTMDWNEQYIAIYVDNVLLNKVSLEKLILQDGTGFNPFKQPHYMLLDLAIGGDNGGDPSTTEFPNRFEVDYVRVYQRK
jgi:beta-glucanase (GH16 family)